MMSRTPGGIVAHGDRTGAVMFARSLSETIEKYDFSRVSLSGPPDLLQTALIGSVRSGTPLISGVEVRVPDDTMVSYARELAGLLFTHISEKFHNLTNLVSNPVMAAETVRSLTNWTLAGAGTSVAEFTSRQNIPLETMTFFAVYLARPLRRALANRPELECVFQDWSYGYCPMCGLWARMGDLGSGEGGLKLWCIGCDHRWRFARLRCSFCLERNPDKFGYLRVDDSDRYRAYACDTCRRYLKVVVRREDDTTSLDAEYLGSSSVDVAATYEKYIQDFVGYTAFDMQDSPAAQAYRQKSQQ